MEEKTLVNELENGEQNFWAKQVITKATQPYSIEGFCSAIERGTINFDRAMQRKKDRWTIQKKSGLIHSILTGFGMLPLHANKVTSINENGKPFNTYYVIDGKQRGTTTREYVKDGFALDFEDTRYSSYYSEEEELIVLQGKKFSELPQKVQNSILSYSIVINAYDNLTEEQEVELMDRLNNGEPMSFFEKFRIKNHKLITSINSLVKSEFMQNLNMTDKQRIASEDEQLVINILSILYSQEYELVPDFQKWGYWEFGKAIGVLNEERKEHVSKVFEYTHKSINFLDEKIRKKITKKSHVPGIVLIANQAYSENISEETFSKWIYKFFMEEHPEKGGGEYRNTVKNSAGKKEYIEKRSKILKASYDNYFKQKQEQEDEQDE